MKYFAALTAHALHTVALALWLGGLVAIGALVAPTAFHVTRALPEFAGNLGLQNSVAGAVVGGSLRVLNYVCLGCAMLLLLTQAGLFTPANRRASLACLVTTLLLLASVLYLAFVLTPAMDLAQSRHEFSAFDQLHHFYEQLSTLLQMPLLLLLALCAALRDTPRQ